jgi:hypothetical protein
VPTKKKALRRAPVRIRFALRSHKKINKIKKKK